MMFVRLVLNKASLPLKNYGSSMLHRGKTALVTGSTSGIGKAIAEALAAEGANIVLNGLTKPGEDEALVADFEKRFDVKVGFSGADLTNPEAIEGLMGYAARDFGGVDILVNNAGYTWDGMLHKMSDKQWEAMLAVHNTAPFRLVRAAAPYMRDAAREEQAAGKAPAPRCIINVSSTQGYDPSPGLLDYAATKFFIRGFTQAFAQQAIEKAVEQKGLKGQGRITVKAVITSEAAGLHHVVEGEIDLG